MSLPPTLHRLTEAEYLEIERAADSKSEFFDGEMFAMAGGTPRHSLIATNIAGELRSILKGKPCAPYNSALRIKVEATGLFAYPDVSVVCGDPAFAEGTSDTVVNPGLIVEVLSEATEAYDRGKKFENYRQIPSLREYLLVSQYEAHVELFSRQADGQWLLTEASGLNASIELASAGAALSLGEIYCRVRFGALPPSTATPV